MSDFVLILSSLRSRWLNSILSVFLTAFGIMLALLIVEFGHHVQNRLNSDGKGIDIVVGAKGSPLQLILSSVYHIDIPTGNIEYDEAQKWMKHPQVKTAIPLALGDNWKGFRIVGTMPAYMDHYHAELSQGRVWQKPFEAVAGSAVVLPVGAEFNGAHGLMQSGHVHEEEKYKITGVMKPTGTVLDRLILTSLDSVLDIHGLENVEEHEHHEHGEAHEDDHEEEREHHQDHEGEPEITALLLTTKSPIANINLPRSINRESILQAANPALEMARLTSMLGLGSKTFAFLSSVLVVIAALSVFAGLAGSLENRAGDLAVLRALGYAKLRLFKIIMAEGLVIVAAGIALGIVLGFAGFSVLTRIVTPLSASGAEIHISPDLFMIVFAVLGAGIIAALVPAIRASRIDVARHLARGA